jgi:hypothetical protein
MDPITEKENRAELDWVTDKISSQVRWFAVGVLAFVWGLLTAREPAVRCWTPALVLCGLLGSTTLFADFLQYVAGYRAALVLRAQLRRGERVEGYDPDDVWRRVRHWLFLIKQGLAVATFLALIVAVAPALGR